MNRTAYDAAEIERLRATHDRVCESYEEDLAARDREIARLRVTISALRDQLDKENRP